MARSWLRSLVLTASILTAAGEAHAQSNYRLAPVGGRTLLLGGTGMVYGRDSAAAFLNPATAVLIDDQRLSFSVNFYSLTSAKAPHWFAPGAIDQSKFGGVKTDAASKSTLDFDALPSSLCLYLKTADIKALRVGTDPSPREARLGLCFAMIQNEQFDFSAAAQTAATAHGLLRQGQTISQSYRRFAIGPTYAMRLNNVFSLGASFQGSIANHRSLLEASATSDSPTGSAINSNFYSSARGDAFQLEALLGATMRFGRQTIGLSIKTPSLNVFGTGAVTQQTMFDGPSGASSFTSAKGSFVSRSPLRVGLGTGLEGKFGQFEVNALYSAPLGSAYSTDFTGSRVDTQGGVPSAKAIDLLLHQPARGVVNFSIGGEFFTSERISILSGISTDVSAVPASATRGGLFDYYPARTTRLGASFGIGTRGVGGDLLVGAEGSYGWGDRTAVDSYQLPPAVAQTQFNTYQLLFVIAGSTSIRAIRRAVQDVTGVVIPNVTGPAAAPPPPPPAKPGTLYNPAAQ